MNLSSLDPTDLTLHVQDDVTSPNTCTKLLDQNLETDCSLAGYIEGPEPKLGQKYDVIIDLELKLFLSIFHFFLAQILEVWTSSIW